MINISDINALVSKFAPLLGAAISTANPLAGMVVSLIASAFGANKDDPEDIFSKINSNENAAQKLKELELEHQNVLSNNSLSDVESARDREIETTKVTGKRDYIMETIAVLIVVLTFILIAVIYFYPGQATNGNLVNIFMGNLMAAFMVVVKYYF